MGRTSICSERETPPSTVKNTLSEIMAYTHRQVEKFYVDLTWKQSNHEGEDC